MRATEKWHTRPMIPYWNYDRVVKLYKKQFPEIAANIMSHDWYRFNEQRFVCEQCGELVYWGWDPEEYITIVSCQEKQNENIVKDIIL